MKPTGGPAYPVATRELDEGDSYGHQSSSNTWQFPGMTLRDYFAAKAMQGMLANEDLVQKLLKLSDTDEMMDGIISVKSYQLADAMLKEREK